MAIASVRIARVRITENREQFFACPRAHKREAGAVRDWEREKGRFIRVELPPIHKPDTCPGLSWRVLPEDVAAVRKNWPEVPAWACEHELDMD